MAAYVSGLHKSGRKAVLIVDPGIAVKPGYPAYDQAINDGLFIRGIDGDPYLGKLGCLLSAAGGGR